MKPYKQGDLDSTCGLYAVINAVRLAVAHIKILPRRRTKDLYLTLINVLDQHQGIASVIEEGMSSRKISLLLREANKWLEREEGICLQYRRPFYNRPSGKLPYVVSQIDEHLSKGGSVLVDVLVYESHWSVVREVTQRFFVLLNSTNYSRISRARLSLNRATKGDKPFIIYSHNIFFVSVRHQ